MKPSEKYAWAKLFAAQFGLLYVITLLGMIEGVRSTEPFSFGASFVIAIEFIVLAFRNVYLAGKRKGERNEQSR